jgi:hypothetical protein
MESHIVYQLGDTTDSREFTLESGLPGPLVEVPAGQFVRARRPPKGIRHSSGRTPLRLGSDKPLVPSLHDSLRRQRMARLNEPTAVKDDVLPLVGRCDDASPSYFFRVEVARHQIDKPLHELIQEDDQCGVLAKEEGDGQHRRLVREIGRSLAVRVVGKPEVDAWFARRPVEVVGLGTHDAEMGSKFPSRNADPVRFQWVR